MPSEFVSTPLPSPAGREPLRDWSHQTRGYDFARAKWDQGLRGLLLAYGMGTGKSRIATKLIGSINAHNVLIACPLRVVSVWEEQFRLHADYEYAIALLDERVKNAAAKAARARDLLASARARHVPGIIVVNYESLCTPVLGAFAVHTAWSLIVADEVHRLKQASGRTSRFFGKLTFSSSRRLGLSGTPLPHSPLDAWAIYRFLDPRVYDPTYNEFKTRYAIWGGFQNRQPVGWREMDDFKRKFYSIALRVATDDVLDLPPELDQTLYCQLSPVARVQYTQLETNFITWLGVQGEQLTISNALEKLLRLQQLTGGTLKDDQHKEHHVDSSKENLLADWLEDLAEGEPVVLFARFLADLDAMARACKKAGRTHVEVSGRSPNGIGLWQGGTADILLAQISTAGEGQDFTRARYAGYYSMGFSLKDYEQSRARIRRPGQTRPVVYYHFLARNTVDEIVLRAVLARQDLIQNVLKEYRTHGQRFSISPK